MVLMQAAASAHCKVRDSPLQVRELQVPSMLTVNMGQSASGTVDHGPDGQQLGPTILFLVPRILPKVVGSVISTADSCPTHHLLLLAFVRTDMSSPGLLSYANDKVWS